MAVARRDWSGLRHVANASPCFIPRCPSLCKAWFVQMIPPKFLSTFSSISKLSSFFLLANSEQRCLIKEGQGR